MDRKLQQRQEIERLIRLSDSARSSLEDEAELLRQRLDVPARLRNSLKSHPTGWLVGSVASGFAASLLFGRRSQSQPVPEKKRRGLPLTLLGLSLTAVRPFAKVWLTDQVKHYFAAQRANPLENHPH
ncbi:MAG: hypothetical protein RLZZ214_2156 [Verrucomicrobiota bacterium]|jgi:hypothetical protein